MKKIFFFIAALAVAFTANAKVTTILPDADNDALRLAVHYAEDGDIIEMTEGTYVQCNNNYVAFDGKAVTVRAAEGANVVLQLQVPITLANGGKATLENIKIDLSRSQELSSYEHLIYASDATEGKELVIEGCEFYGYTVNSALIYSSSSNKLNLCKINNCYFHDIMKSCIFFEGVSLGELKVTNSTFANVATDKTSYKAGVVDVRNADATFLVDHCTFYNCLTYDSDCAALKIQSPSEKVVVSNNIFVMSEPIDGHRAIRPDQAINANNCLTFNYLKDNGGFRSQVNPIDCKLNVDPLFVGATNGNYALGEGSPALGAGTDGSNLGDPRWNAPAVEEPTYDMEIVCTDMKTSSEGNMTHFLGTSADGMDIDLIVFGFKGAGTYEGVEGSIYADGPILFTGTAEYAASAVEGTETNVLTADLALANGMTVKLTMYNLNAGDTDEPGTPGETIAVEMYDATFTVEDGELAVEAENDDHAIVLWLSEWNGYGDYEANSVWGFVDDVEVANLTEGAYVEKDGLVATLYVVLTNGTNTYNVIVSGMAPAEAGDDDEPVEPNETITITANNLTASVPYDGVLLLKANANDADNTQIFLWLVDGDTKGYDEYGYTEYPSGLWPDIENASYGDVNLTLSKETPAKYYQDGTVDKFEGTFLGDDNNLYILVLSSEAPATALDNVDTTVAPAKVINNGQLIIIKNGVRYNTLGATVK